MKRNPARRVIASNPYWTYFQDRWLDRAGVGREYHHVGIPNSVMVVPVLEGARFVMVRQWRLPVRAVALEFPGGGIAAGESPRAAAQRELREETGYKAETLVRLGKLHPNNGLSNEVCTVFAAGKLKLHAPAPDETESLEILILEREEVERAFRSNAPIDAVSLAAWHLVLRSKTLNRHITKSYE